MGSAEEKGRIVEAKSVKVITGEPAETIYLRLWLLMNSRSKAGEPTRDQTSAGTSAYGQELCSLVCFRGPRQWEQDLSLVNELAFWNPITMVGVLLSLGAGRRSLVLPHLYVTDSQWKTLAFLRSALWVG